MKYPFATVAFFLFLCACAGLSRLDSCDNPSRPPTPVEALPIPNAIPDPPVASRTPDTAPQPLSPPMTEQSIAEALTGTDRAPRIDKALVDWLDALFPQVDAGPGVPYEALLYRGGARNVIEFLRQQAEVQARKHK